LTARHPGMHKTNTIDYAVILSGEIDMLVDEDEVHLQAGDALSSVAPIMRGRIGGQSHAASRLSCSTRRPYLEQIPLQARSGACRAGRRRVGGLSAWPASEEGVTRQPTERENALWRRSLG